jgi:hypothetical protein
VKVAVHYGIRWRCAATFLQIVISFAKSKGFLSNWPTHCVEFEAIPQLAPFAVLLVASGLAGHTK